MERREEYPAGESVACLIRDADDRHVVRRWLAPHNLVMQEFELADLEELIQAVDERRIDVVLLPTLHCGMDLPSFHRLLTSVGCANAKLWTVDARELISDQLLRPMMRYDNDMDALGPLRVSIPRFFPRRDQVKSEGDGHRANQARPTTGILEYEKYIQKLKNKRSSRLSIDLEESEATVDGKVYRLEESYAAILYLLNDAYPGVLSRQEMKERNPLLRDQPRIDRIVKSRKNPKAISIFVKSNTKGYYLDFGPD